MGIAPEGTRSPNHALQEGKTGAAYLATRARAPILPVGVWGVEKIKDSLRRARREPVTISYGPVYRLPDDPRAKGDALAAYTTEIMCRIAALLPEQYRGVYAGNPRVRELESALAARVAAPAFSPTPSQA
jgi:1-acyl-sn-glycerol-3-phosphate acyltransferase